MPLIITSGYGSGQLVPTSGYGGPPVHCGLPFNLDSVETSDPTKLRLRFTGQPGVSALDPSKYTLTGSGAIPGFIIATFATDDLEVVDLYLASPLPVGVWNLTAAVTIFDIGGKPLLAPYTVGFITAVVQQAPISLGAKNSIDEDEFLLNFNPAFRGKKNWKALAAGLAAGDALIKDNVRKVFDQLYINSASGIYLEHRAADRGIAKPTKTGIQDNLFRQLVISVANAKLTQGAMLRILEVLYGVDSVRAFAETKNVEPFVIVDESSFRVLIDEQQTVDVVLRRSDFKIMRRAKAEEVAVVITRALSLAGTTAYAIPVTDPVTGGEHVRIYSGSRGLGSSVRILYGTAQPALEFPSNLFPLPDPPPAFGNWSVDPRPFGRARYSSSGDAFYNLSTVEVGDYIVVQGTEFSPENRGTFVILDVHYAYIGGIVDQWVEVENINAVNEVDTQCEYESIELFRPIRRIPYDSPAYAVVTQHDRQARVVIPAITQAVNRHATTGAYANVNANVPFTSLTRLANGKVSLTTSSLPADFDAGDQFEIIGLLSNIPVVPAPTGGTPSTVGVGNYEKTGISQTSTHSAWNEDSTVNRVLAKTLRDFDKDVVIIGGQTQVVGGTFTTQKQIDYFTITSTILGSNLERSYNYTWRGTQFLSGSTIFPIGLAADVMDDPGIHNEILIVGGYNTSPWEAFSTITTNLTDQAILAVKTQLQEEVLSEDQLSNTQGILAGFAFFLNAQPINGDFLTVKDDTVTRTYTFGGNVAIGVDAVTTLGNLASTINVDAPANWFASFAPGTLLEYSANGAVVIYEKTVSTARSSLRAFGTFTTPVNSGLATFADGAGVRPNYAFTNAIISTVPVADPVFGTAGFHRAFINLIDGETHRVTRLHAYRRWNAGGPSWDATSKFYTLDTNVSVGNPVDPTPKTVADATVTTVQGYTKALLAGGSSFLAGDPYDSSLNTASVEAAFFDQITGNWTTAPDLNHARMQHQAVQLDTDASKETLLIGGRQPAISSELAFSLWTFDDTAVAATYTGPVPVSRAGNPRPPGKLGWGARLSAAMVSTGGAPQTTLNGQLLGEYTIAGWMTSPINTTGGSVFFNGNSASVAPADNVLIAFFADFTSGAFSISWKGTVGINTMSTTQTFTDLMPVPHDNTYPRYYHVAITKALSGGNVIWTLYINGRSIPLTASGISTDPPVSGASGLWRFGDLLNAQYGGGANPFTGSIDHWGILVGTVLEGSQVTDMYVSQLGVAYDSPENLDAMPIGRVLNQCEIVSTNPAKSRIVGSMSDGRFAFGMVKLPDGRILVAGGIGYNPSTGANLAQLELSQRFSELRSAEIYDPILKYWSPIANMFEPHSYVSMAYVPSLNRVYIAGGFTSTTTEYLDLTTMQWQVCQTHLDAIRTHTQGALAGDDILLLAGGGIRTPTIVSGRTVQREPTSAADNHLGITAETVRAGGLEGLHIADTVVGTTVTFTTPDYKYWTLKSGSPVVALIPVAAEPTLIPGPFTFAPSEGFGVSAVEAESVDRLEVGHRYSQVQLQSGQAALFPDEPGYLVFQFGYSNQIGPIKYLGRLSNDILSLDASFRFSATVEVGGTVTLLASRGPFIPNNPETLGSFYLTASPAGRVAAEALIREISAAGIELDIDIRYPGDRGLGGEGFPQRDNYKLSDKVEVWGSDDLDNELREQRLL